MLADITFVPHLPSTTRGVILVFRFQFRNFCNSLIVGIPLFLVTPFVGMYIVVVDGVIEIQFGYVPVVPDGQLFITIGVQFG